MAIFAAIGEFVAAYGEEIAAVAAVASAATAAVAYRESGIAADKQARQKARAEQDKANAEQIAMRQKALRALSSQNASTLGAIGTGTATSFGAATKRQIQENQMDLLASRAGASVQEKMLQEQGTNASEAGSLDAFAKMAGLGTNQDLLQYIGSQPPPPKSSTTTSPNAIGSGT